MSDFCFLKIIVWGFLQKVTAEELTGKGVERGDDNAAKGHRWESNRQLLQRTDSLSTWGAHSTN